MGPKTILLLLLTVTLRYPAGAQVSPPPFHYISPDSVVTYISNRYEPHSFLRKLVMGKNYRKVWQQPVTLPVFRLSKTSFTIDELGGGKQTKSLKLTDSAGKAWALRTLEKDVTPSLPPLLQHTIVHGFLQDQISSSMPYGSLIIGQLAKAAGITAAQPTYFFVADDPALGEYSEFFANRLCMLEERDPGFDSTVTTETVMRQLQQDNRYEVDQQGVLRARLLDMLVVDFDRHHGNWRWGLQDTGDLLVYHAIPRDRDWAFYYSDGLIPKLSRLAALRFLINLTKKPKYIRSLNAKALDFDALFLDGLDAANWLTTVASFQQALSDSVIEAAVRNLPPAVFSLIGPSFIEKLKGRRNGMQKAALSYYQFLSRHVQVDGSADAELFSVLPADDGFVLQVWRQKEGTAEREKIYERRFFANETFRVTINALGGNDRFEVDKAVATKIRLRLNGGTGTETYDLNGNLSTEVNDTAAENNILRNNNNARVHFR